MVSLGKQNATVTRLKKHTLNHSVPVKKVVVIHAEPRKLLTQHKRYDRILMSNKAKDSNMTTKQKTLTVLIAATILTNPLPNQYIIEGVEWLLFNSVVAAPFTIITLTVYVVFIGGMAYADRERINIPKKSNKSKKSGMKYEVTK